MSEGEQPEEKSFWAHLDDLRSTLFKIAGTLLVFFVGFLAFMPYIFDHVVLAPCHSDFFLYKYLTKFSEAFPLVSQFSSPEFHIDIINTKLTSQFFTHLTTSLWFSLVFAFPVILYFLWQFISPALYKNEKHGAIMAFGFGSIMFYIGVCVGYFIVFPITIRFLYEYELSEAITNMLALDSYMSNFLMLNLVMGIVFELPLLSWVLSQIGLLHRSFFKRYRKHSIVALMILTAIITPTGDPFTLFVVFLPIYCLYEGSAFLVKK